jgi:arylsulfatase A-like enzyme
VSAPNVFFLVIDSLRADVVFDDQPPTPNLAGFIASGAAFTQCISTTTTTTPSFSSMLTGCYPPKHGVRGLQGYRLSATVTTWAEAFSKAGYKTYAEVTGPLLPETGVLRGFDEANHRPGYRQPFFGWRDDVIAKLRAYERPFFMLLHIWEVHRPYRMPPDFTKRLDKEGYEGAVAASDERLGPIFDALPDDTIVVITGDHGEQYARSAAELKLIRAATKVRRKLKLSKWFVAADNRLAGLAVGHGFGLYEPLVRVPLVIAGPGVPRARVDDQVRHVDLLPTVAELCGVETPTGIDGRSLVPLMQGLGLPEEPAYIEAVGVKLEGRRIMAARTPDWKLVKQQGAAPALYRLDGSSGPDERHNLYRRYPEVAGRLEAYIDAVNSAPSEVSDSGMTAEEEAVVEQHLRDLGYL